MKMEAPVPPRGRKASAGKRFVRWQGALDGIHNGIVYGWAFDVEQPDSRVVLEICLDGEPAGTVTADVARSDLHASFTGFAPRADNCHGFVADLRALGDRAGAITARVANVGHELAGRLALEDEQKPPMAATSFVFGDGGLRLHGWAFDAHDERRSVTVEAYLGGERQARATASLEHAALRARAVGKHGFILDLPMTLADGQVHSIRVVDETGRALGGSPVTVCCYGAGPRALAPAQAPELLLNVVDGYERNVPHGAGFQFYSAWVEQFERGPMPPMPSTALCVGVIVTGTNKEGMARTRASIKAQTGVRTTLAPARPFAEQLRSVLEAGADMVACVRAGDTLAPHALASALAGFGHEGVEVVYTDAEYLGRPWFKPAWNRDYAYATDYPLELMLVRANLALRVGGDCADAACFAWSALGAAAALDEASIVHVPRVLYQFHSQPDAAERQARMSACQRILQAAEPQASLRVLEASEGAPPQELFTARRVVRQLNKRERALKVSLIIPTRDCAAMLERCIGSILRHTDWPGLELIVVDNGSVEKATLTYFRALAKQGVRVLSMPGPFNFSELNNCAVYEARGDLVGLVNNDIEALHDGWLDEMVAQLMAPGVGMVGAKLLWPNGMVQHGGVLMGMGNAAGHYGNQLADADWGDHGRNQLVQQVSGVTAACLLVRKSDYLLLGGLDPHAFPVAFNDVDLCLRMRHAGRAITWTPFAKLLHAESASRGKEDSPQKQARARRELEQLRMRWGAVLLRDPAYHPSLNLYPYSAAFGALALPPRDRAPRTNALVACQDTN
jgi:GT2 family glycosyltransferase